MTTMTDRPLREVPQKTLEALAKRDRALLERVRAGDLDAFQDVVKQYRPVAVRIALGYLRNEEEATDCSQDAFVKAFERIHLFDLSKAFFPWFFGILRNVCLKRLRTLKRRQEYSLADQDPADLQTPFNPSDEIARALGELTPEHREVVVLRHWEELSYEAIAAATGVSVGTVMSRLFYARRQLRRRLAGSEEL